jgi:3-oxoacyl-[acyl-carrier protein] reductase
MDLALDQRVAFVTGGARGIGAATARLLAQEGCHVVIGFHSSSADAERTADAIRQRGRTAWLCQMDVTDPIAVEKAVSNLPEQARRLDVLVLCAGEAPVATLSELTAEEWKRVVNVNLNGAFNVLRATQSLLNVGGSIVAVASVAAQTGVPHQAHYAAAKAGLVNLTKSAARELAPSIRVNCVAPGMTLTEMGMRTAASLPKDYVKQKLLLEKFAQPEEIANCIVFLASGAASFVTGATLDVNGGRYLR